MLEVINHFGASIFEDKVIVKYEKEKHKNKDKGKDETTKEEYKTSQGEDKGSIIQNSTHIEMQQDRGK